LVGHGLQLDCGVDSRNTKRVLIVINA
jgi:hypothetical protein